MDYEQLANALIEKMASGAPAANRNYSQETMTGVLSVLKDKGYDEDAIDAARVTMTGAKQMIERTVESALAKKDADNARALRDRDAENFVKGVLKEHYADPEYGSKLKAMEASIRKAAFSEYFGDANRNSAWGNNVIISDDLEKALDNAVDSLLKDVLGKDSKATNPAINAKPTSSEGAVAGKQTPAEFAATNSGDMDKQIESLSEEQRQMYDAKFIRLTQRLGRDPEKAKKEALESAQGMPAYFPTRGLTAQI